MSDLKTEGKRWIDFKKQLDHLTEEDVQGGLGVSKDDFISFFWNIYAFSKI